MTTMCSTEGVRFSSDITLMASHATGESKTVTSFVPLNYLHAEPAKSGTKIRDND